MNEITGNGFVLRPWREGDEESLARHGDDAGVADNLRDGFPQPYTIEDARTFIRLAPEGHLAIEVDGQAVGGIGFTPGRDVERLSAEVGYWLGRAYWGRGITTLAVRQLADHLFATTPIIRLFATPYASNRASMRVLEKAGFTHLTTLHRAAVKHGRIVDMEYYELLK